MSKPLPASLKGLKALRMTAVGSFLPASIRHEALYAHGYNLPGDDTIMNGHYHAPDLPYKSLSRLSWSPRLFRHLKAGFHVAGLPCLKNRFHGLRVIVKIFKFTSNTNTLNNISRNNTPFYRMNSDRLHH